MQVLHQNQVAYEPKTIDTIIPLCQNVRKGKIKTMIMRKSSKKCSICLEGFIENQLIKKT